MQEPLFRKFLPQIKAAYDGKLKDAQGNPILLEKPSDYFRVLDAWGVPNNGVCYLSQMLHDMRTGVLPPLTKEDLKSFGKDIRLAPGLPDFFTALREKWKDACDLRFYIVSVGLREMIEGNPLAGYVDGIFASELVSLGGLFNGKQEHAVDAIRDIVTPFSKIRDALEICKGGRHKVDMLMSGSEFELDYRNVISIGDGLSDVSQFAYLRAKGATIICVYKDGDRESYYKASNQSLLRERVDLLAPRDYTVGNDLWIEVNNFIRRALERQCDDLSPQELDLYKKGRLKNKMVIRDIREHLDRCSYCQGSHTFRFISPQVTRLN